MIICVCHRISDRDITKMSRTGATFDELQWELGVATQCGRCEDCAREVHAQCQASGTVAHCRDANVLPKSTPLHANPVIMLQPA